MFTVLYKDNGGQEPRLGLAISKKHCLKRAVRESFRHHRADLEGLDVVVLNRPAAMRASNKTLFDSLHKHWQRCHTAQSGEAG